MRAAAAAILAVWAGAATADEACAAAWARLESLLSAAALPGAPIKADVQSVDGGCMAENVVLGDGARSMRAEAVAWSGEGLERFALEGLPPRKIKLVATGVRPAPDFGDPVFSYLQDASSAGNRADMTFEASWDPGTQRLTVSELSYGRDDADFARFAARVEGVNLSTVDTIWKSAGNLGALKVTAEIRSHGWFEATLLMPLGIALIGGAADPEKRVEELKAATRGIIGKIPETLADAPSKEALGRLVADMPNPAGTLRVEMTSETDFGMKWMIPFSLRRRAPADLEEYWPLLDGVRFDVRYVQD